MKLSQSELVLIILFAIAVILVLISLRCQLKCKPRTFFENLDVCAMQAVSGARNKDQCKTACSKCGDTSGICTDSCDKVNYGFDSDTCMFNAAQKASSTTECMNQCDLCGSDKEKCKVACGVINYGYNPATAPDYDATGKDPNDPCVKLDRASKTACDADSANCCDACWNGQHYMGWSPAEYSTCSSGCKSRYGKQC